MVSLNGTSLFIYNLFGHFGPFHWLAASSLLTLMAGMQPVLTRQPKGRWLEPHAILINISYIGLVAASKAVITSRISGTEDAFGLVVGRMGTSDQCFYPDRQPISGVLSGLPLSSWAVCLVFNQINRL